jgi:hypothetical protein
MNEHSANGVTDRPILRIADLVPARRPVVIGQRTYQGWMWGRRCPRSVEATVVGILQDMPKAEKPRIDMAGNIVHDEVTGQPILDSEMRPIDVQDTRTQILCTLIEGLDPMQADLLSHEEVNAIFRYLEYVKDEAPDASPDSPLVQPTSTTGETSPSDSPTPSASGGASS